MAPEKTPEEKARGKAVHRRVVLLCGGVFLSAASAALWVHLSGGGPDLPGAIYSLNPRPGAASRRVPLPSPGHPIEGPAAAVPWETWGARAFEKARRGDRLVLLDVTSSWSHWCHLMDESTYSDREAAAWIERHAVPVRVDSDARPDIAQRYLGGWPTTALLLPSGEMLSAGAYIPVERFVPWASRVEAAYRRNRDALLDARENARRQAAERRQAVLVGPGRGTWEPQAARLAVEGALQALSAQFDASNGGFGEGRKFHLPASIRFLLEHHEAFNDPGSLRMATQTLDGVHRLEDPVWGGVYRYSAARDWLQPEYEKLLSAQAAAIEDLAAAGAKTGEGKFLDAAGRTVDFVERFMKGPEGYWNSVDADVRLETGGWIDGDRYYALGDKERREKGLPVADKTVYVGPNADLAAAYLGASIALRRDELREAALALLERMAAGAVSRDGAVRHAVAGGEAAAPARDKRAGTAEAAAGLLADQLAYARASAAAYRWTRDRRFLERSRKALTFLEARLKDPESGGYRVKPSGPAGFAQAPVDGWTEPVDADRTAEAGLLRCGLYRLTKDPGDGREAHRLAAWAASRRAALDPVVYARLALCIGRLYER